MNQHFLLLFLLKKTLFCCLKRRNISLNVIKNATLKIILGSGQSLELKPNSGLQKSKLIYQFYVIGKKLFS